MGLLLAVILIPMLGIGALFMWHFLVSIFGIAWAQIIAALIVIFMIFSIAYRLMKDGGYIVIHDDDEP